MFTIDIIKPLVSAIVEARKQTGLAYTPRTVICKTLEKVLPFKGYGSNPLMADVSKALKELYGTSYAKVEIETGKFRKVVVH